MILWYFPMIFDIMILFSFTCLTVAYKHMWILELSSLYKFSFVFIFILSTVRFASFVICVLLWSFCGLFSRVPFGTRPDLNKSFELILVIIFVLVFQYASLSYFFIHRFWFNYIRDKKKSKEFFVWKRDARFWKEEQLSQT